MKITYSTGFTQIPNKIVRSHTLTPSEKIVLMVLCSYADDSNVAYPSYRTIAADTGISRRKVIDIINNLIKLGCIKKTERKTSKGDNAANDYEVLIGGADFALPGDEITAPPNAQSSLPRSADNSPRGAPNQYINNNINNSFKNIYQSIGGYDFDETEKRIKDNIDYEILKQEYKDGMLEEAVSLISETICGNSPTVRIGGNDFPREAVRSVLLKLDSEHVRYALDRINNNTTDIRNIKAYMLTTLYNAPHTIETYYRARVNHDLYGGD